MIVELAKIDTEQFMFHPHVVNGEQVWLIQPKSIGVKWTQSNKHLRSCVVDTNGNVISLGFNKFTNWGENPEHFPTPNSLKGAVCVEKLDGSLLIVSRYNGQHILRTRGTVDASKLENGFELEVFKQKYPKVLEFQDHFKNWPFSFLFEWTTPENRIVIRYGDEPEFSLVGAIYHNTGKLWTQEWLDSHAQDWGCPRPIKHSFDDIPGLLSNVDEWQGKEGICVYSDHGQSIHKIKSAWYLVRHRLKEEFGNIEKIVDFFMQEGCPSYFEFGEKIARVTDWETFNKIQGDVSRICEAWKNVGKIIDHMKVFVEPLKKVSRKEAAAKIISSYGNTNRSSFCFSLLDGKELGVDQKKKLLWQSLKD